MKQLSSLYSILFIFISTSTYITKASDVIQFKTKDDLKEFYFKHIHMQPEELDQQFNREFFDRNPLSIPVKFPAELSDKKAPGARPVSNWHEFTKTWVLDPHVSLLEGIFVYVNQQTDPDVLRHFHDWLTKSDINFKNGGYTYGDMIPALVIAKIYNYEISTKQRHEAFLNGNKNLVYKHTIASADVGKGIFKHSNHITDKYLKKIAACRPDAIVAFLRVYGPHYTLTPEQTTRFENLGFQIFKEILS